MKPEKRYDGAYFRRFYLNPKTRVLSPLERRRRVAAVVGVAERFLDRRLASVLDVGCGLGLWGRELLRQRPRCRYLGVEPSEAAVKTAGKGGLDVRLGDLAGLDRLVGDRTFDLVLCVDVLHYLPDAAVELSVATLAARSGGLVGLEVLTSAEGVEGDVAAMRRRSPHWYRELFARHGLRPCGLHLYLTRELHDAAAALETLG